MRGRLSVQWIWHNVYPADYYHFYDRSNPCRACKTHHSMLIPRVQWGDQKFQDWKMNDPEYEAYIDGRSYAFDGFLEYTRQNGQLGNITIMNGGPHLTLDNGHHRLYIAWLLKEKYVRVVICGADNIIPEEAFEPNSINSSYLYV